MPHNGAIECAAFWGSGKLCDDRRGIVDLAAGEHRVATATRYLCAFIFSHLRAVSGFCPQEKRNCDAARDAEYARM